MFDQNHMFFLDLSVFLLMWGVAQFAFANFERHVFWRKRILKLVMVTVALSTIHLSFGRSSYWLTLGLMTIGIFLVHVVWFQLIHGVHWRKAEPREKYLNLIARETADK